MAGAAGRFHSVVITKEGESFAFGSNQLGQCGIGSIKKSSVKGVEGARIIMMVPHGLKVEGISEIS